MSIKIFKVCYFYYNFKWNEKQKVQLIKMVWKMGLEEHFCWRGFDL